MSISYYNRSTKRIETEKVLGESWIRSCYESNIGKKITDKILAHKKISQMLGSWQNTSWSSRKISKFVRDYHIQTDEFSPGPYPTFNDFFIRPFLPGKRPFSTSSQVLPAPAEARYLGFRSINPEQTFPVKGKYLSVAAVMDSYTNALPFIGGPCLIARLCPVDYHRFHFPDSGKVMMQKTVSGKLHSVNPVAVANIPKVFCENERQVALLQTDNFGKILMIEVGALMVGKIVQTYTQNSFQRGQEKGYFLFGGSTVILFGEPGAWEPSKDILEHSAEKREVFVRLGEEVGLK